MRVAFLTTDNREQQKCYDLEHPFFGTAPTSLLEGFAQLGDKVEIHVISCTRRSMASPEKLADNTWFHQPLVSPMGWGRTAFLGCGLAVRKIVKRIQPDLVHAQGTERDCGVSMMLSPNMPRLLTIHGHMARIAEIIDAKPFSYYWLVKQLEAVAIHRADGIVAITNYTQKRVSHNARQTWVVPNAVDASFFDINAPGNGNLALCVASLSPWKRQLELIEAMDGLPDDQRPELVFLGGGADSEYGRKVSEAVKQRPWCSHPGEVDREQLKDWLKRAGLLILPSTEDNCPMVILEAMAAGVPVAASRIGGIPDLIDDGKTGFLFDPLDAASIRKAVMNWSENPERTVTIANQAKKEALARFHPQVIAQRHLEVYSEVIAANASK